MILENGRNWEPGQKSFEGLGTVCTKQRGDSGMLVLSRRRSQKPSVTTKPGKER